MNFRHLNLCLAASFVFLLSCQKDQEQQSPPPQPTTEQQVNLSFVDNFGSSNYELIITDSTGKYVLDTVLPVNKMISSKFLSNDTKFNITTIEFTSINLFRVKTYYQVSLKQWYINQYFIEVYKPQTPDLPQGPTVTYINIPAIDFALPIPTFCSGTGAGYNGTKQIITLDYRRPDPYYSYLLIPSRRLYKFHQTITNHDTVSLSKMDTSLSVNYKTPFEMAPYGGWRELVGYKKKDDYLTYTKLWDGAGDANKIYGDIMYPRSGVEQYLVRYFAQDKLGKMHYTVALADTMPTTLEFLDDSYINVIKKSTNNYEVNFPKGNPTMYSINLRNDKLDWEILLPPGKTSFNGTDKLIDLQKAQLLKSFDFTTVKPAYVNLIKADNYNYYDYLDILFDPNAKSSIQKIKKYMQFATTDGL